MAERTHYTGYLIGACITFTEERKKSVLFSEPYYTGGISALVRQ